MPAYVIVDVDVHDATRYEDYKQLAPPSIAKHGGKYIARGGKVDVLEGNWTPKRLVILEFPSVEQARKWWESTDYAEAKSMRHAASTSKMVIVEGL